MSSGFPPHRLTAFRPVQPTPANNNATAAISPMAATAAAAAAAGLTAINPFLFAPPSLLAAYPQFLFTNAPGLLMPSTSLCLPFPSQVPLSPSSFTAAHNQAAAAAAAAAVSSLVLPADPASLIVSPPSIRSAGSSCDDSGSAAAASYEHHLLQKQQLQAKRNSLTQAEFGAAGGSGNKESIEQHISRLIADNEQIVQPSPVLVSRRKSRYNLQNSNNPVVSIVSVSSKQQQTAALAAADLSLSGCSNSSNSNSQDNSLRCLFCKVCFNCTDSLAAHEQRCGKREDAMTSLTIETKSRPEDVLNCAEALLEMSHRSDAPLLTSGVVGMSRKRCLDEPLLPESVDVVAKSMSHSNKHPLKKRILAYQQYESISLDSNCSSNSSDSNVLTPTLHQQQHHLGVVVGFNSPQETVSPVKGNSAPFSVIKSEIVQSMGIDTNCHYSPRRKSALFTVVSPPLSFVNGLEVTLRPNVIAMPPNHNHININSVCVDVEKAGISNSVASSSWIHPVASTAVVAAASTSATPPVISAVRRSIPQPYGLTLNGYAFNRSTFGNIVLSPTLSMITSSKKRTRSVTQTTFACVKQVPSFAEGVSVWAMQFAPNLALSPSPQQSTDALCLSGYASRMRYSDLGRYSTAGALYSASSASLQLDDSVVCNYNNNGLVTTLSTEAAASSPTTIPVASVTLTSSVYWKQQQLQQQQQFTKAVYTTNSSIIAQAANAGRLYNVGNNNAGISNKSIIVEIGQMYPVVATTTSSSCYFAQNLDNVSSMLSNRNVNSSSDIIEPAGVYSNGSRHCDASTSTTNPNETNIVISVDDGMGIVDLQANGVADNVSSDKSDRSSISPDEARDSPHKQRADSNVSSSGKLYDGYRAVGPYVYVRGRGRGPYVCARCGIRCRKPSLLKKHLRTHTDARPYACPRCLFSFKTKGNLTKHLKSKRRCLSLANSKNSVDSNEGSDTVSEQESESDQQEWTESDEESLAESSTTGKSVSNLLTITGDERNALTPSYKQVAIRRFDGEICLKEEPRCYSAPPALVCMQQQLPSLLFYPALPANKLNVCTTVVDSGGVDVDMIMTTSSGEMSLMVVAAGDDLLASASSSCRKQSYPFNQAQGGGGLLKCATAVGPLSAGICAGSQWRCPNAVAGPNGLIDIGSYLRGAHSKHSCSACGKQFDKEGMLRMHMNVHALEKSGKLQFKCPECPNITFRSKTQLDRHCATLHGNNVGTVVTCSSNAATLSNAISSTAVAADTSAAQLASVSGSDSSSANYQESLTTGIAVNGSSAQNPRPFECTACQVAFRIHGHLAKHLRSKGHIWKLECLRQLPIGLCARLEEAGINLAEELDTTDCDRSLTCLQTLARRFGLQIDPDEDDENTMDATEMTSSDAVIKVDEEDSTSSLVNVDVVDEDPHAVDIATSSAPSFSIQPLHHSSPIPPSDPAGKSPTNSVIAAPTNSVIAAPTKPSIVISVCEEQELPPSCESLSSATTSNESSSSHQAFALSFAHRKLSTPVYNNCLPPIKVSPRKYSDMTACYAPFTSNTTSSGSCGASSGNSSVKADVWVPPTTAQCLDTPSTSRKFSLISNAAGSLAAGPSSIEIGSSGTPFDMHSHQHHHLQQPQQHHHHHQQQQHSPRKFSCPASVASFSSLHAGSSHGSGIVGGFMAAGLGIGSSDDMAMDYAMSVCEPRQCLLCGVEQENAMELGIHLHADHIVMRDGKDFKCPRAHCERVYPNRPSLRAHIATHYYTQKNAAPMAAGGIGGAAAAGSDDCGDDSASSAPPSRKTSCISSLTAVSPHQSDSDTASGSSPMPSTSGNEVLTPTRRQSMPALMSCNAVALAAAAASSGIHMPTPTFGNVMPPLSTATTPFLSVHAMPERRISLPTLPSPSAALSAMTNVASSAGGISLPTCLASASPVPMHCSNIQSSIISPSSMAQAVLIPPRLSPSAIAAAAAAAASQQQRFPPIPAVINPQMLAALSSPALLANLYMLANSQLIGSGGGVPTTAASAASCPLCGVLCADVVQLNQHVMCVHNALRPFVCNRCDAGFTSADALAQHVQTHSHR